ncbi:MULTISPECIES: DUF1294 domain-containing protein [unclassified Motilimonas]|uniref:DUF1294 domain-containing protein n=1 Tax=Motilimonas TaxID=1914248 RepID=UPI001E5CC4A4|nr:MULTISPECIES: DUF1294 domain-containing protein [unclassified Motilimonas]MCE0559172.1 DUF1294 domain-containing protein [Motilimonas sp. E26]MDO6525208.1 DUF1294 domain-containing protein [Motilimonas sp. 1_MG-2023]
MKLRLWLVAIFFSGLLLATGVLTLPIWFTTVYSLMSVLTFALYGKDKSAARKKRWRVKERTLHLFALFGGWPGAMLAQQKFRHKTQKQPFRFIYWLTIVTNCAVLVWLCTSDGRSFLQVLPTASELGLGWPNVF